jgi:hypothetical protein
MDDTPEPPPPEDTAAEQDRSYEELACEAIHELIDREHAVVWHEVEAHLADHPLAGQAHPINPHHLSNARRRLIDDGVGYATDIGAKQPLIGPPGENAC